MHGTRPFYVNHCDRHFAATRRRYGPPHNEDKGCEMTMAVLQDLATKILPVSVSGETSVQAILILQLAGHIKASILSEGGASSMTQAVARVLAITDQGYRMLRYFPATRPAFG